MLPGQLPNVARSDVKLPGHPSLRLRLLPMLPGQLPNVARSAVNVARSSFVTIVVESYVARSNLVSIAVLSNVARSTFKCCPVKY